MTSVGMTDCGTEAPEDPAPRSCLCKRLVHMFACPDQSICLNLGDQVLQTGTWGRDASTVTRGLA